VQGLRRRLLAFVARYHTAPTESLSVDDMLRELSSIVDAYRISHHEVEDMRVRVHRPGESCELGAARSSGTGMVESKVQYVRQMMFQYLLCNEDEVKQHIEAALMAIFRFTEEEKLLIENRRKEDSLGIDTTLSSFTSFLGSFTSAT
jgi:hypothetical protein